MYLIYNKIIFFHFPKTSPSKINSSKKVDYKLYYTPETIELVKKYDNELLNEYNYYF